jgi:hypothetical protein
VCRIVGAHYVLVSTEQDRDEYLTSDCPLEVVDGDLLEPLPGVDRVVAKALQPREQRGVQSHQEVDVTPDL